MDAIKNGEFIWLNDLKPKIKCSTKSLKQFSLLLLLLCNADDVDYVLAGEHGLTTDMLYSAYKGDHSF